MTEKEIIKLLVRIVLFIAKNDYQEREDKLDRENRDDYLNDICILEEYNE